MASDIQQLEDWAGALLNRLEPKARRQLSQHLARDLRRSHQKRIRAQRNPDGSAYTPRKKRLRESGGRIRQRMFNRLSTTRFLKVRTSAAAISLEFLGRTARIARVHQKGLRERPGRNTSEIRYPKRELLGFSAEDLDLIRSRVLDQLGDV